MQDRRYGLYWKKNTSLIFLYVKNIPGFWIDRIIFHEQPKVDFRGEYLFAAFTDNMSHPIVCSSFNHFKGNNLDTCVYFKVCI